VLKEDKVIAVRNVSEMPLICSYGTSLPLVQSETVLNKGMVGENFGTLGLEHQHERSETFDVRRAEIETYARSMLRPDRAHECVASPHSTVQMKLTQAMQSDANVQHSWSTTPLPVR